METNHFVLYKTQIEHTLEPETQTQLI